QGVLKRQMEFVLGATGTGLDIIDSEYNVKYVDPEWAKQYGDYHGRKCYEYFMGANDICQGCGVARALVTKKTVVTEEILAKEGNKVIQVTSIPYQDEHGNWLVAEVNVDITALKTTQRDLERNQRQLEAILNNIPDMAWLKDEKSRFIAVNEAFSLACGVSPDDLLGKTDIDIWSRGLAKKYREDDKQVMEARAGKCIEEPLITKDGREIVIETIKTPIFNDNDEVIGTTGIARDITDRKKTEERLRESEEEYRTLFDSAADLIAVINVDGTVLDVNRKFEVDSGYSQEEIIGKDILKTGVITHRSIDKVKSAFRAIIKGKGNEVFEIEGINKNGDLVPYELRVVPIRKDNRTVEIQAVLRNIAERKQAERAIHESEEKYRNVVEMAQDGICVIQNRKMVYANPQLAALLAMPADKIVGNDFTRFLDSADEDSVSKKYEKLISGSDSIQRYELSGVNMRGEPLEVEISSCFITYENEPAALVFIHDIRDRKLSERRVEEARNYLDKIINSIADPIFVKDEEHKWILMNNAMCDFMGYKREELLGKSDYDFFPKEEADVFWEKDQWVFDSGKENVNEEKFTDAVGVTHTIRTKKTLYVDRKGKKILVGIIRDITQIREVSDDLSRQKTLLAGIIENIPHFVFWKNRESVYAGCNPKFAKVAGFNSPEEVVGKNDYDMPWKKEEADHYRSVDKNVMDGGRPVLDMEESQRQADGKEATLLMSKVPLFDGGGNVTGVLGIYADITERKSLEDLLRLSEMKYRTIFENTGTAMIIIDAGMNVVMANSEFEKLLGYSKRETENIKTVMDFICEEYKEEVKEYHRLRGIDPNSVPRNYEVGALTSGGERKELYLTVALIPDTDRTVVSFLDVTELKNNEAELKKQKDLLDKTNHALEHKLRELQDAISHIKRLEGLVPICANCKKMLVEGKNSSEPESWIPLEKYISERTDASFTHGLCPACIEKLYGDIKRNRKGQ
ncbi:MAG: PAS domain S-box protein, partial [Candidatus Omnitrophica bacterium]|nr:PAS domain S-box protein [Candidatus Omnitrophota bacterium]MDD5488966.1 PAS domain S-box protein [Candidatus Omnitrophota bacterium]